MGKNLIVSICCGASVLVQRKPNKFGYKDALIDYAYCKKCFQLLDMDNELKPYTPAMYVAKEKQF